MLIGLAGRIGSGKDMVAKYLESRGYDHYKLAHPLQDITAIILGVYQADLTHRELFDNREWKEATQFRFGNSPRDIMKAIGTHCREHISETIWSTILYTEIEKNQSTAVVISDVRYPDEYEWVKYKEGLLVYIQDPDQPIVVDDGHPSEAHHDFLKSNADLIFYNYKHKGIEEAHSNLSVLLGTLGAFASY